MMDRKRLPPLAAHTLRKFTDAMFYGVDMQISSQQVVDNIQEQFANSPAISRRRLPLRSRDYGRLAAGHCFHCAAMPRASAGSTRICADQNSI
jgi:hypothetical protein